MSAVVILTTWVSGLQCFFDVTHRAAVVRGHIAWLVLHLSLESIIRTGGGGGGRWVCCLVLDIVTKVCRDILKFRYRIVRVEPSGVSETLNESFHVSDVEVVSITFLRNIVTIIASFDIQVQW